MPIFLFEVFEGDLWLVLGEWSWLREEASCCCLLILLMSSSKWRELLLL